MASTAATLSSPLTIKGLAHVGSGKSIKRTKVNYITGLNSFGGLKAINNVVSLGLPASTEQSYAQIFSSLNSRGGSGGGALSSTCNAIGEIFKIAAIMPALVLIGVAVGFVLLRIEASVEEAE